VAYRWVLSHERVEGNKKADKKAKAAALGEENGIKAIAERYRGMSLARIQRKVTEGK
jgi:ribonuclease HI